MIRVKSRQVVDEYDELEFSLEKSPRNVKIRRAGV